MVTALTETAGRLQRIRDMLEEEELDLLLVSPSADLRYLTGHRGHPSERPTLLAVQPDRAPLILVAGFEAPGVSGLAGTDIVTYGDAESPYAALAGALGRLPSSATVAISDQTWAGVLLALQATFPDATFVPASPLLRRLRMHKSPQELALLREAGRRADAAFERLVQGPFAGRTEREIASRIDELLRGEGIEQAEWGPIVGSGPNATSPHHSSTEREIREGDAVVLDFGGAVEGYQADITRTVHVGDPGEEFRLVYDVVRRAQEAGVKAARAGVAAQQVDRAAREIIQAAGYGEFFTHRTGHGIGLEDHEEPYIVEGSSLMLEAGMTFSVEPGIYLPDQFGVRIEDIVVAGDDEGVRLNHADHDLIVVR
jgi:D-alanyl-D-alanine dipeptidase